MTLLSERLHRVLDENPTLAQSGLAKAAGVSKSVVNQWMNGKISSMNIDAALNIESALGYNHIWLMTCRGDVKVQPKQESNVIAFRPQLALLEMDELEIITCYREATEPGRISIRSAAQSVTKRPHAELVGHDKR